MVVVETTAHPCSENLRAFAEGRLPALEAARIEEHLLSCDACCLPLEATPRASFESRLREAFEASDAPALPPASANAEPGELADHPRYRLIRLLGQGGMGAVYLGEHCRMGRSVALKVIKPDLLNHARSLPRFQQEVRAAAKLDHPNIVAAYDADQAGSLHFLVMEYVDGQNLADYLHEKGPLPWALACDMIRQAALGVQHAHERGMVHRDIKPHNLMLTPSGQVKVLDFGLARFAAEPDLVPTAAAGTVAAYLTEAGAVMGTADYIAPEQARDARDADGRSDVYSLGCTLYHLLTGRPPLPQRTGPQARLSHHAADSRRLNALPPDAPDGLARVVAKMMAERPEDRFQTAAAAAAALTPFARNVISKRTTWRRTFLSLAGFALFMLSLAAAGIVRLPVGPDREIVIETDDPALEVIVKGDRIVRIVHPKTGKAYQLDRSDLTLSLADDPDGLSVTVGERPVLLKRQGRRIAAVWLASPRTAAGPAATAMMIQVEMIIAQFGRAEARRLLSRWLAAGEDEAATFGIVNDYRGFLTELNQLRAKGKATILAQPTVVTLSARPACVELNEPGQYSGTLDFVPTLLDNGRIQLSVIRPNMIAVLNAAPASRSTGETSGPGSRAKNAPRHVTAHLEAGQAMVIREQSKGQELIVSLTPRLVDQRAPVPKP
jgi:hypothetical protein